MTQSTQTFPAPGSGSSLLRERLAEHASRLSRTERTIAEYLAQLSLRDLPFVNAEMIATATGTSDASVIRTARSLGFSGLPELKRHASRPHTLSTSAAQRIARQVDELGPDLEASARTYFDAAREVIEESRAHLDPEELVKAVTALRAADTVWAIGIGTAGAAALHLADALGRTGIRTRWTRASGFELANELAVLRPADVIVLFHAASPLPEVARLIDYTHHAGIPLILVSSTQLADSHHDRVTASLRCVGTASRLASWNLGAVATAELLALLVTVHDPERAADTHVRLSERRAALTGERPAHVDREPA